MKGTLVVGAVLGVLAQIASLGLLLTSGWLVVRAAEQPPVLYLLIAVSSVRMFGVARAVLRYAERLLTHDAALGADVERRVHLVRVLGRLIPGGLGPHREGEVVATAIGDVERIGDRLLRIRLPWWTAGSAAAVVVAVVAAIDGVAGLILGGQTITTAVLVRWVVSRQADSSEEPAPASDVVELVRASTELMVLGAAPAHRERAHRAIDAELRVERGTAGALGVGEALVLTLAAVAVLVVSLRAGSTEIDSTLLGVLVLAPLGLADALLVLVDAEARRPAVASAEARLAALAARPAPVVHDSVGDELSLAGSGRDLVGHGLALEGLVLGYDAPVTTALDVRIAPGEVVAVMARSGGGKTTLAHVLGRFIEPLDGRVTLGGRDLASLPGDLVRSVIGLLDQRAPCFDTTVRENLLIGSPKASDRELWAVLERVRLAESVRRWPDGLGTDVGEAGRALSGGERQRLALARLLLGGHQILVLDEPTEHLDPPTAQALADDILALAPEHTVLVLTHDRDLIERCSRRVDIATSRVGV